MILIAIGSNLAGRHASPLAAAVAAARRVAALPMLGGPARLSRWYATAPVPASDQPDFVNGVLACPENAASAAPGFPAALLAALHAIEAEAGRIRGAPNAARVLDLDLLAIGDLVRAAPDPVLPHPRLHERLFVLEPLRDVAPDYRHPVLGLRVEAMIAAAPGARIETLPQTPGGSLLPPP